MDKSISFKLVKINTKEFAKIEDNVPVDSNQFLTNVKSRYGIDPEKRVVATDLRIEFENSKKQSFIILEFEIIFELTSESWTSLVSKDKITIPISLGTHLATLAVGTARGILHEKTSNSKFNKFILPTINVTNLIEEDVSFNLTTSP